MPLAFFLSCTGTPQPSGLAYVDPMIGTEGDGTELGAPCVREATLHIGAPYTPATLHIVVRNLSPECTTIRSITWNGQPVTDYRIHHNTLIQGGELVFEYQPSE